MASHRLTKQELSWLLAQEARNAASILREDVKSINPAPPTGSEYQEFTSTLDALDDAMRTLASLNSAPSLPQRRGRIDMAALIWDLAPNARVKMETSAGMEVSGDEGELRRMVQVLLSFEKGTSGDEQAINIWREGDDVCISVPLGSESGAQAGDTEHAWLSRMATRFGGSTILDGKQVGIRLPAHTEGSAAEVQSLKKELAAAQEQGEAYARELASLLAKNTARRSSARIPVIRPGAAHVSGWLGFMQLLGGWSREELARAKEGDADSFERLTHAFDLVQQVGQCLDETTPDACNLKQLAQEALRKPPLRQRQQKVPLEIVAPDTEVTLRGAATSKILRLLVEQALDASPKDAQVSATLETTPNGVRICVDDAGAPVPEGSREAVVSLRVGAPNLGRPSGSLLFLASQICHALSVELKLADSPLGGLRAELEIAAI